MNYIVSRCWVEGALDAANILKPALAGAIASHWCNYLDSIVNISKRIAHERRFQTIIVKDQA